MPLSIDNISLDGNITGTTLYFETVSAGTVTATTMVVNNITYNQPISTTANTFTTGTTVVGNTIYFNRNDILSAYSATVNVSGSSSSFTGGTVTGPTNFTGGLSANTISATTYSNLPTDIRVTGGTTSRSGANTTLTFTNNSGSTFNVGPIFDTYITGFTYANNLFTLSTNSGETDSVLVNTMTGLTVNGNTVSTTISGTSYTGNNYTFIESVSAATPTTGATLYLSNSANRKLLTQKSALGITINYQPAMFNSKIGFWNPSGNVATVPGIFGIGTLTAQGTATAVNVATTNMFTRTKRISTVSANPAGSACGFRNTVAQLTVGTGTAGIGGFYYVIRFGCGDALTACRQFVGLRSSTAAPTDVEPSTLTNCIGVGHGIANTNLLIYYGGSAAQTPINLGASFPANTNSTDLYELALYAPSTTSNEVWYQVTRLNTGDVANGRLTGTAGTALPASTTLLTNNDYRSNGGIAGIVTLNFISIYVETEN